MVINSVIATEKNNIELGPRPFFLINNMDDSELKEKLKKCSTRTIKKTNFSIGHRGAAMQFPEHTRESYKAAVKMGAGIVECDVTFTKDKELVCRHSQCDLHATTNILTIPELAAKCSVPFTPADRASATPATAKCCTSDITLQEFKTLKGKMDASNPDATTVAEFINATPNWRTDLYASIGTVMSHKESIELFKKLEVKFTPELKSPEVTMPYAGKYTQADYAQQMIDEYKDAGVPAENIFAQSFSLEDIQYWIKNEPAFGKQAVYLDGRYDDPDFDHTNPATWSPTMEQLVKDQVKIIAPPLWMLLELDIDNNIIPSTYAKAAKAAGLKIITWTLERSGPLKTGGGWYHRTITKAINNDGDTYKVLDVLAKDVGVIGVFSDWPATVSYYANCLGLD
ncbi:MAG: glycerophosphodiester phosphodiesterase family protein [Thiohalomonadales bacterium]